MQLKTSKALRVFSHFCPGYGIVHGDPDNADARHVTYPEELHDRFVDEGFVEGRSVKAAVARVVKTIGKRKAKVRVDPAGKAKAKPAGAPKAAAAKAVALPDSEKAPA